MKNLKRTLALAALMTGTAGVANATEGWYGRLDVGYSFDGSVDDSFNTYDLDDGNVFSGGVGYAFSNGFRLEGALDWRVNDIATAPLTGVETHDGAIMANLYYDFNRGGTFQPYLGVGVGYNQLDIDTPSSGGSDGLAYQGMAGVGIALSDRAMVDIGYRYFEAPENDYTGYDVDYIHQSITVGLRWQFHGAPPPVVQAPPPPPPPVQPPPPPPPVACPTSDFVVYFEWDRSNLNQAALETIDAAVARARQCRLSSVVVVGHTDTSGSAQYNIGLSERRASVVRDALVARGIAAGSIQTQARGETEQSPLLQRPTRDGVREPLNRRTAVTITFR